MPRSLIPDGEVHDTNAFTENARRYFRVEGIVLRFYPPVRGKSPACVDVQPGTHDVRFCTTAGVPAQPAGVAPLVVGQRYSEPWQPLHKVPIRYPSGGGRAMWWRLQPGDKVDLEAPDLDPSTYRATGQPSDPPLTRRNSGTFWTAIPGSTVDSDALPDPEDAICVGSPDGVMVAIDPDNVNLGAPKAPDAVALATQFDVLFKALLAAMASAPPLATESGYSAFYTTFMNWAAGALGTGVPWTTFAAKNVKAFPDA